MSAAAQPADPEIRQEPPAAIDCDEHSTGPPLRLAATATARLGRPKAPSNKRQRPQEGEKQRPEPSPEQDACWPVVLGAYMRGVVSRLIVAMDGGRGQIESRQTHPGRPSGPYQPLHIS